MTDALDNLSLQLDENIYKAIFDSYNYPVLIAEPDGKILDMNPTACQILEVERETSPTRRVEEFFRWDTSSGDKPTIALNDLIVSNTNGPAGLHEFPVIPVR